MKRMIMMAASAWVALRRGVQLAAGAVNDALLHRPSHGVPGVSADAAAGIHALYAGQDIFHVATSIYICIEETVLWQVIEDFYILYVCTNSEVVFYLLPNINVKTIAGATDKAIKNCIT